VVVSTNEVFDGQRTDGVGYTEDDLPNPINPYGRSKLAGERSATSTFEAAGASEALTIVRTAWLYGPSGSDFPTKILAAARRLGPDEALKVVHDEVGSPTSSADVAEGIVRLLSAGEGGIYHLANAGHASRFDAARLVLQCCLPGTRLQPISRTGFVRASTPPAWAVLNCARAGRLGIELPEWDVPLKAYARHLCS
jgi:dTDP-4-dehydrorhamnose reductase